MKNPRSVKEPLYRKINSTAYRMSSGGDYRDTRHSADPEVMRSSMHGKSVGGFWPPINRDYRPLFKFLLSKCGQKWDEVYSEAVARLDQTEPIFHMVALHEKDRVSLFCSGVSSFFSGLYVDAEGYLQIVDPSINHSNLRPACNCCTYSFNGQPFSLPYSEDHPGDISPW